MGPSPDLYHVDVYIAHTSRWQYAEELKFTNQEFFIFSIHFFGYKVWKPAVHKIHVLDIIEKWI